MTTTEEIIAKAAFDYSEGVDVDFAAIAAEVRGQLAELDALQADAARLDWLESKGWPLMGWTCRDSVTGRGYRLHQGAQYLSMTAREAIDAAIKEAKP